MYSMKRGLGILVGFAVLVIIVMFVFRQPETAGNTVGGVFGKLGDAGDALGAFLGALIG